MRKIKIILLVLITLFLIGCGKYIMYNSINGIYNEKQIDSLCLVEKIPNNYKLWLDGSFIDYESKDSVYQYTYIKQYRSKDNDEIIYNILKKNDSLYKFSKRVVEYNKKKK